MHFISAACRGESCVICGKPATHKLGEEIRFPRHNLTNYVCCVHFTLVVGPAAPCDQVKKDIAAAQRASLR